MALLLQVEGCRHKDSEDQSMKIEGKLLMDLWNRQVSGYTQEYCQMEKRGG